MYDYNESSLVQVTNNGSHGLKFSYASRLYLIEPGGTVNVPYYAACTWFGRPDAVDDPRDPEKRFRTEELDRMSTFYGTHGGSWRSTTPYTQTDFMDERVQNVYVQREDGYFWHPNLPDVTVRDLDGNVLPVVVTDPEGDSITPAEASSISEQKATTAAIESLQQQLHSLRLQLARQKEGAAETPEEAPRQVVTVPDALPEAAPSTILGPTIDAPAAKRGPGRPRKVN